MTVITAPGAWHEVELTFTSAQDVPHAYTAVEFWATFTGQDGTTLQRPAFWDGGRTWRLRFASPRPAARWSWVAQSEPAVPGLSGSGIVEVAADPNPVRAHHRHGFWQMSPGRRSLVHADGTPVILVADTAWALPWRATPEQALSYASDRAGKGFNAVLLMSVQPDMRAVGPRERTQDEGFAVGFEDLPAGHLNDLNPDYFQDLDALIAILRAHDLVPVLQPVFQGFGWKGLDVAGTVVPPAEYARYCRYLLARYGAGPAVYLVGADGAGDEPQIAAGGVEVHEWDCYRQPTGVHYRPHGSNRASQDEDWLDFQWCQTGHRGEHVPERVADMFRNLPVKAVANGEPTYEHTGGEDVADGWWQGHEAWSNLCAGGTMGIVYGAANVWQWKLHHDEPGHSEYFTAPKGGWRESLDLPGSVYVGLVASILRGLPTTDMQPDWQMFLNARGLRVPGKLNIVYQEFGGVLPVQGEDMPNSYRVIDPKTGAVLASGERGPAPLLLDPAREPRVIIFHDN